MANVVKLKELWVTLGLDINAFLEKTDNSALDADLEQHIKAFDNAFKIALAYNYKLGVETSLETRKLKQRAIFYGGIFATVFIVFVSLLNCKRPAGSH